MAHEAGLMTSAANLMTSATMANTSAAAVQDTANGTPWADLWWKERVQVASPDWGELRQRVRWLWPVHAYGMACLFLGLAVTAFLTSLGLRARLSARPHLSTLNVFLLLLGLTRCLCLFLDPYGSRQLMPGVMLSMLWDLGFPCLLSAFSLLQLAFLQITQTQASPARVGDETCISLVVVLHFCLAIASNICWAMQNSFRVVWLFTQLAFTAWGLFLCSACVCSCLRLQRSIAQLPMLLFLPPQSAADTVTACYDNKGVLPLGTLDRPNPGHHLSLTRPREVQGNPDVGVTSRNAWDPMAPRIRITDEHQRTLSLNGPDGSSLSPEDKTCSSSSTAGPESCQSPPQSRSPRGLRSRASMPLCPSQLTQEQQQPLVKVDSEYGLAELHGHIGLDQRRCTLPKAEPVTRTWDNSRGYSGSLLLSSSLKPRTRRGQTQETQPHQKRSRVERLLRKTLLAAVMGIALCCFHGYGVAGPHGMFATSPRAVAVFPWFAYHTLHRFLEFVMACTMAGITRKSLYSNCYRSHSYNEKYRGSIFS